MPPDIAIYIIGGLCIIVSALLAIIYKAFAADIKASRDYRHHKAPALFTEVHARINRVDDRLNRHKFRLDSHDKQLAELAHK